jgi:hypothetical protein
MQSEDRIWATFKKYESLMLQGPTPKKRVKEKKSRPGMAAQLTGRRRKDGMTIIFNNPGEPGCHEGMYGQIY